MGDMIEKIENDNFLISQKGIKTIIDKLKYQYGGAIKFKNTGMNNQVVIESEQYFYKIYSDDSVNGWFLKLIRKAFEKIYQSIGIEWEVEFFEENSHIYTLEKRQKLNVYENTEDMSKILLNYIPILEMVEDKLNLDIIKYQLNKIYPNINKIKLIRTAFNNPMDYASWGGASILLDDADFELVMVDQNGKCILFQHDYKKIIYPNAFEVYVCNSKFFRDVRDSFEPTTHLWLFNTNQSSMDKCVHNIMGYKEACFQDNIDLLMGKKKKLEYNTPNIRDSFNLGINNKDLLSIEQK